MSGVAEAAAGESLLTLAERSVADMSEPSINKYRT